MTMSNNRRAGMLAVFGALLSGALPARAADTTYERLVNPEPQNWLMNHHDYTSQRSGEIKKRIDLPYPNSAGVLSTAGGIVVTALIDGTVGACLVHSG